AATLEPLAGNVPGLKVDMRLPRPFPMEDPERAHVLLRCTQEIITNAVRHAQASVLQLQYTLERGAVRLVARDDGRGADGFTAGNGLRGMRERLSAYGGEVEAETAPGQGFTLRLRLPLDGVADIAVPLAEPSGPLRTTTGATCRPPPPPAAAPSASASSTTRPWCARASVPCLPWTAASRSWPRPWTAGRRWR